MNGGMGRKGQPWSIVGHLLYKNIFLEVGEEAATAEEPAPAVGVALPYMEDELNFLVNEGLLRREGNGYRTDFLIRRRRVYLPVIILSGGGAILPLGLAEKGTRETPLRCCRTALKNDFVMKNY